MDSRLCGTRRFQTANGLDRPTSHYLYVGVRFGQVWSGRERDAQDPTLATIGAADAGKLAALLERLHRSALVIAFAWQSVASRGGS